MTGFRLDRSLELVTSPTMVWGTVAGGFALLALALAVLAMTRLGQANPLRKCLILSVLTHVLLAFMLSSVQFAATTTGPLVEDTNIKIVSSEDFQDTSVEPQPVKPWERFVSEPISESKPMELERPQTAAPPDPKRQSISDVAQLLGDANVVNLPLDIPDVNEAAPLGDAILAGVGAGIYRDPFEPVPQIATIRQTIEPDAAMHQRYAEFFSLWQSVFQDLQGAMDRQHALLECYRLGQGA